MGLLGNASLSSYLPSSDTEEEFLKSSQPCDVGNPAVDETCKWLRSQGRLYQTPLFDW
jgi:hypothetical protein